MGFQFLLKFISLLNVIWITCFLQNIESNPASSTTLLIPDVTEATSTESDNIKFNSDESREGKNVSLHALSDRLKGETGELIDKLEINAKKNKDLPTMTVPYLCDIQKRICWQGRNAGNLVTLFIPIQLLPNDPPPAQIGLKELYSLLSEKKLQMDLGPLSSSSLDQHHSLDVHRRRKRDIQYSDANDNPQQEWPNQAENGSDQQSRAQRDLTSTTATSTDGRPQRSAEPQPGKQSKRSTEMEEDEVEDKDAGSPTPEDEYQDEEDETDYQPDKRFAGQETTGSPVKDAATKIPSQLYRREVMSPSFNYPMFANPDLYYPQQRIFSPFDGISYRSADPMPMWYMGGFPGFWPGKMTRNPQHQYRQRGGYGGYNRGWASYYQPYANRYQPAAYAQQQPHRGHHYQQQQSPYRPYSYNYGQQKTNYKAPAKKPIETDASMYYGK